MRVEQLTKAFGAQTVVEDVSFTLAPHTATALIGPNGAGKTTTLSMLAGLLAPTSGSVVMDGVNDLRTAIGFLPQYPKFYAWLTALEFTEMVAGLSGVSKRDARQEAKRVLGYVGLEDAMHKKTATFSGGMKQRLGMAQAIVHKPKLLLLDEPVSALDPVGRRELMELLKGLQQETTILYSTHILNDAEEMTDQLLFMRNGRLVEQGSLDEVREKYAEPRLCVTFQHEADARHFAIGDVVGNTVIIDLERTPMSMPDLLSKLAESGLDVVKVERVHANLEEIFMKVVQE